MREVVESPSLGARVFKKRLEGTSVQHGLGTAHPASVQEDGLETPGRPFQPKHPITKVQKKTRREVEWQRRQRANKTQLYKVVTQGIRSIPTFLMSFREIGVA